MTNIKKIFAIAILGIFAVACTDEDQLTNETKVNKKIEKSDFSPLSSYPEYEQIDITDTGAMSLLVKFNEAMRGKLPMPSLDINHALLAMEMYFNYAVVDKQTNYDSTITYPEQNFEFTVNYDINNRISGSVLKSAYTTFLNNVINQMNVKYMRFSDLIVSGKTETTITFKIIIPPHLIHFPSDGIHDMVHMPSCPIVRNPNEIPNVPDDVVMDLGVYFNSNGQLINGLFADYPEEILHSYCIKPLVGFVYGITSYLHSDFFCEYLVDSNPYVLMPSHYKIFDNHDMMDDIIPKTLLTAQEIRASLNNGSTLLDITPNLHFLSYSNFYNTLCGAENKIVGYREGNLIPGIEVGINLNDITFFY